MKLDPRFLTSKLANVATRRRPEDAGRYEEGLRLAGLRL